MAVASSWIRAPSGAFATSIVTTRWESSAAAFHADLAGRSPRLGEPIRLLTSQGIAPERALAVVNDIVDRQAVLLATNHLFWEIAMVFGFGTLRIAGAGNADPIPNISDPMGFKTAVNEAQAAARNLLRGVR